MHILLMPYSCREQCFLSEQSTTTTLLQPHLLNRRVDGHHFFSNLLVVVVGLSRGTVLSSAMETTPPAAAFLSARGSPWGAWHLATLSLLAGTGVWLRAWSLLL